MYVIKKWFIPTLLALMFSYTYEMLMFQFVLLDDVHATRHLWRDWSHGYQPAHYYASIAGVLMTVVLLKIFKIGDQGKGMKEGLNFGVLMGLFSGLMMFGLQGALPISLTFASKLLFVSLIEFIGIGLIFAFTASKCPICSK